MIFQVEKNGNYRFKITGSNNRIRIVSCKVENLVTVSKDLFTAIKETNTSEVKNVIVKGKTTTDGEEEPELYSLNIIRHTGNLNLDGNTQISGATLTEDRVYEFGDVDKDVSTGSDYAQNTVVLKVEGNLTINENVTLTTVKNANGWGGPKGLIIYCTGALTNNGTIDMTARGAYAKGQNVYIFKNTNTSNQYEFIPKQGAEGGPGVTAGRNQTIPGGPGTNGIGRQTGGGGVGAAYMSSRLYGSMSSSRGGYGTSYSGGTGSGGRSCNIATETPTPDISDMGGSSSAYAAANKGYTVPSASMGAGNPGGGTGGLIIIYSNIVHNNSNIMSKGSESWAASIRGGGSGGGSINIFYTQQYKNTGTINADGVACSNGGNGGAGGNGTITIGSIATGTFVSD